jgi:hypothetical protein
MYISIYVIHVHQHDTRPERVPRAELRPQRVREHVVLREEAPERGHAPRRQTRTTSGRGRTTLSGGGRPRHPSRDMRRDRPGRALARPRGTRLKHEPYQLSQMRRIKNLVYQDQ